MATLYIDPGYIDPGRTADLTRLIIVLVVLLIWLIPAVLVFKDAKRNKMEPPILWAIIVFFAIILGLIAYLIVRNLKIKKGSDNVDGISNADELGKYKKLFDDGVITQEEFNAKKKQILGL